MKAKKAVKVKKWKGQTVWARMDEEGVVDWGDLVLTKKDLICEFGEPMQGTRYIKIRMEEV